MAELLFLNSRPSPQPRGESDAPRVAFVTLGCKVNQSDTQKAIADFRAAGWRIVPPTLPAEVYVVNTCSVTHVADRKSRSWLRRSARANPSALVVATGCYAESGRAALEEMDEVGLIVGHKQKDDLLGAVEQRLSERPRPTVTEQLPPFRKVEPPPPSWLTGDDVPTDFRSRTRAMVKVEDGCNDFCTFCIIPFTRGMPRSTPTAQVLETINARLGEGFREIVLTGVHMGKYGQDHAQRKRAASDPAEAPDIASLVRAVLERTPVPRLRITSLEPTDAVAMLPLFAEPGYAGRLAPHLHLPLQSGCDATLQRMKRDYSTQEFAEVVQSCREAVPGIAITTDLITGFPGETEDEWAQTVEFVRQMGFAKVHVFPYSQRPGTPAAGLPGQVHPDVRHSRTLEMMAISQGAEAEYAIRQLGAVRPVLWEEEAGGVWSGLTDNYLRVFARSSRNLHNTITAATLSAFDATGLWASLADGRP